MPYFDSLPSSAGITDVFFERPVTYKTALTLAQELLRESLNLSPIDRELIATYTSYLNKCEYCFSSHKHFALSVGATKDDLKIFEDNYDGTHRLQPILEYVKTLTLSPGSLTISDKDKVIAAGFTDDMLKDAIGVCAIFNFYNRIVEGHGIKPTQSSWDSTSEYISVHGYDRRY
jgi:uncharacterized peroxidase-related enzyme